jgi:hypothetical protein
MVEILVREFGVDGLGVGVGSGETGVGVGGGVAGGGVLVPPKGLKSETKFVPPLSPGVGFLREKRTPKIITTIMVRHIIKSIKFLFDICLQI